MGTRGRAVGSKDKVDIESLERDNDRGLDLLSERVGLLKAATQGIKNEVDSQHMLLDNMDDGMSSTRGILGSVNDKFRMVMSNKQNRNMAYTICGVCGFIFTLWWLTRH